MPMKSVIALILLFALWVSPATAMASAVTVRSSEETTEVRGVAVPTKLEVAGETLVLNGAERSRRWFINVLVASLYLPARTSDPDWIIESDAPMAVTLRVTTGMVTRERMVSSVEESFERATGGNTAPIQEDVDKLLAAFDREVDDGDLIVVLYLPGQGVTVLTNGEKVGQVRGSMTFKRALFSTWLGEDVRSESLKQGMLGL